MNNQLGLLHDLQALATDERMREKRAIVGWKRLEAVCLACEHINFLEDNMRLEGDLSAYPHLNFEIVLAGNGHYARLRLIRQTIVDHFEKRGLNVEAGMVQPYCRSGDDGKAGRAWNIFEGRIMWGGKTT